MLERLFVLFQHSRNIPWYLLILLCFYNLGGRCIQNAVNVEPKRECYCPVGIFGKNCQNKSPLSTKSYNQSEYNIVPLNGPDFKFMWKLIGSYQDTLEGIIVAKTTSYVALGKIFYKPKVTVKYPH